MVGLATYLRWIAGGELTPSLPFITYFPAIVIAAVAGGLWPGILATILSAVVAWRLFLPPRFSWSLDQANAVGLLVFVGEGCGIAWILSLLKRSAERILAQEQYERALIESSPSGLLVVSRSGAIERVNSKAEELFGYHSGELLGKFIEVLVPQSKAITHRMDRKAYQADPTARPMGMGRDLRARRKDGSEFPVEIGLTPTDEGDAVLATIIDISERKRSEEHQKLVSRELEHQTQNLITLLLAIINNSLTPERTIAEAKEILIDGFMRCRAPARCSPMVYGRARPSPR